VPISKKKIRTTTTTTTNNNNNDDDNNNNNKIHIIVKYIHREAQNFYKFNYKILN